MSGWLTSEQWMNVDLYEDDDVWYSYLCNPENEINTEYKIFLEPSIQGRCGGMFIFDESGEDRFEAVVVDYEEFIDMEVSMASECESADQYKEKYRAYIKQLCNL